MKEYKTTTTTTKTQKELKTIRHKIIKLQEQEDILLSKYYAQQRLMRKHL